MKGGVLIIGSLLWDPERKQWRQDCLNMGEKIRVSAPIRYGRLSKNSSYTMVFSKETDTKDKLGTAYVIPFQNRTLTSDGVLAQAKKLSKVEGKNDDKLVKGGSHEKWCIIGILFNPSIDQEKKNELLDKFTHQLRTDGLAENYKLFKIADELSILNEKGEIEINWLKPVDQKDKDDIDSYDFIIATCTFQNVENYPDVDEILTLIKDDKRRYFLENSEHKINTFQDQEIIAKLRKLQC